MRLLRDPTFYAAILATLLPFLATGGWVMATSKEHVVSQLGLAFTPSNLTIQRGETVKILNDDRDLLHHVYVESDRLKFNSDDQRPGSHINIIFPITGTFAVLCAIHPRMRLTVHVK